MAEIRDDWDKVREMVRNAPPTIAEAPPPPPFLEDEPPPRRLPIGAIAAVIVVLLAVAVGVYLWKHAGGLSAPPAAEQAPPAEAAAIAPAPPPAAPAIWTVRRDLNSVTVRSGPSAKDTAVAKLRGGDRVEQTSANAGWIQIRTRSGGKTVEGWLNSKVLEK